MNIFGQDYIGDKPATETVYHHAGTLDKNMVIEFKYSKESQIKYLVESLQLPLCLSRFSKYGNALTSIFI